MPFIDRLRGAVDVLWREMAKFGIVGAVCFVIDMGGFNVLVNGALEHKVTTAKIVSGAIATLVAWVGNRYWTFRHRRNRPVTHEVLLFFVVNGIALAIAAGWLAFAHYTLNMDGKLANNVNAFIGIGLGTLFRFWTYRQFVFANEPLSDHDAVGTETNHNAGSRS
ncbi:GtrA family protein [Luteipulveratus mongoliensis]|uniref:Membrane protein n=1 Tax=Luteipulveratus mongoliensis TaxID=571913 RepID=A0A0K1JHW8_9MICO|nr:GtrA family protein [Luteipulveratus mongoliensis]AKU16185.1 membrane protein [Luteipulveratus mongoliensis]